MNPRALPGILLVALTLGLLASPTWAEPIADPQVPTGEYRVQLADGPRYLGSKPGYREARIVVSNVQMDDNLTYDRDLVHVFFAGDGSPGVPWRFQENRGASLVHAYKSAGSFNPYVELTDEDGNTATIYPRDFSSGAKEPVTVTVLRDDVAPTVAINRPAGERSRISSWRVVRGTAADVGSGLDILLTRVLQRRDGRWFVYDFDEHKWRRGSTRFATTVKNLGRYQGYGWTRPNGKWVMSGRLDGLTQGRLVIQVVAYDRAGNLTRARPVDVRLTRR